MSESYRVLFFRYLYDKLKLKVIEDYLEKNNIEYINNEKLMSEEEKLCHPYSKYFYLLNEIDLSPLNNEEKDYFNNIKVDNVMDNQLTIFLETTAKRVFFSHLSELNRYYGPISDSYYVNGDYIVLGLKYNELGFATGKIKTRGEIEYNMKIINDIIKKIENNNVYKIKVIKYNELFEKLNK